MDPTTTSVSETSTQVNKSNPKYYLTVGYDPYTMDFTAHPGVTADKIAAGIEVTKEAAKNAGYNVDMCMIPFEDEFEHIYSEMLRSKDYAVVCIGAGVRTTPGKVPTMEKLINITIAISPKSKICFNSNPTDTLEALKRVDV